MKPTNAQTRPLTLDEEAILATIDQEWMIENVSRLVAFPSWGGDEGGAQEFMAGLLSEVGFDVDLWEIDESSIRAHPAYSTELERDRPLGVVGTMRGGPDGPTLVVNGHVDVVPPGDPTRWESDPFTCVQRQGRLFGRGVLDMKGPLVAALAGMRAVARRRPPLHGALVFQSVIGEEDGGLGTLASVLRGHTGDGAIVLEPTGLSVASAQAGALNFRLSVPGRAAHGALRSEGVSAIENFIHLHGALVDLESERNRQVEDARFAHLDCPFPICVGTIRGGEWASSVPERLWAEGRFGLPVSESVGAARDVLERRIAEACGSHPWLRDNPAVLSWWGGQFAPCQTDADMGIVRTALEAAGALDVGTGDPIGVPFGSDLRLLVNEGATPGVLFGPGDIRGAHRHDESIAIDALMDGARATALTAMRFLG